MINIDHNHYNNMIYETVSHLFTETISTEEQTNFVPSFRHIFSHHP